MGRPEDDDDEDPPPRRNAAPNASNVAGSAGASGFNDARGTGLGLDLGVATAGDATSRAAAEEVEDEEDAGFDGFTVLGLGTGGGGR